MNHPPKLIQLLQKNDFLSSLFSSFHLDEELLPTHIKDGNSTKIDQLFFGLFKANNFRVYNSPHFHYFLIEFGVHSEFIFDNVKEFCTNEIHTQESAWLISGKISRSYLYFEDDTLTNIMINKTAKDYIGIRIWHETKTSIAKHKVDLELSMEGELRLGKNIYQSNYGTKPSYAKGELEATRKWKNIELSKEQAKHRHLANQQLEGLYECAWQEAQRQTHIIYMKSSIRDTLLARQLQLGSNKIKLRAQFKRHNDHSLILKSIMHLELV